MPIDLSLSTNTSTGALEFRQAQPMPDGSGYAAFLVVRSGGLAAALPYFWTAGAWAGFVEALAALRREGLGAARLPAREGDDYLDIAHGGDGLLAVSGMLHDAHDDQLLRFRYLTPLHGLDGFLADARRLAALP